MNSEKKVAIWGTGSLAQRYLDATQTNHEITCFIDSNKTGVFNDKPVITPDTLIEQNVSHLIICSTFINEIVPTCFELGFEKEQIDVVQPRSLDLIALTRYADVKGVGLYYLPWKAQQNQIDLSLNSDIVFPDVYKEIAKSIAYVHISAVEGDFAEFGTCTGYTASLIAHSMKYYSNYLSDFHAQHDISPRNLCLFDSFQGFPASTKEADLASPHVASGAWGEGTAKGLSANELKQLCSQFLEQERIAIYEGWYKDTLSTIEPSRKFGFVHLDCDLYESTYDVLYHLFSHGHLSEGAKLMFDNWYCNKASKSFGEQKAWQDIIAQFDIECTHVGMYAAVGHKIIIHSYSKK